ncbi:unnamed protein product [Peronospora farinosa]|uniref:PH domain-containing protein n=1 Tax=Peronospora farinosa TaxID=134698 RepID=A0AAV0SPB0_9STRA|nr:unnamed protein product [Peronospora farinosa]CAI5704845.1 unnamed protein product [Peronospora farinosa]
MDSCLALTEEKKQKVSDFTTTCDVISNDIDSFDKRMTRSTSTSISSSTYMDLGDGTRYHDIEDEIKSSIAPLSIEEEEYTIARVQTVQSASNVLTLSSRGRNNHHLSVPMRRYNSSQSVIQAAKERKKNIGSHSTSAAAMMRASKAESEKVKRTGFARIYFENTNFTSSTVFKLLSTTTVLEVRKSMAAKIKISMQDFNNYAIVVVFPTDVAGSLSARTLRDEELILPLVEKLNRARPVQTVEADDTIGGTTCTKPKHRSRPPVKFVLKDVQGSHLDINESPAPSRRQASDTQSINFPVLLGKGVYSGYLQKASSSDSKLWRKRWFIIKGDQLLYCKSNVNQQDVTSISLLGAVLAKAKPEVRVPFSFQLKTPRRDYELCASNKDEMVAWIHALHIQIGLCSENHRLYEAEIWITEDAVNRSEQEPLPTMTEPSLLERVLSREDSLKLFRDFVFTTQYQSLLDTWIECELFRRSCIARENRLVSSTSMGNRRTVQDEWNHLKAIIRAIQLLNIVHADELNKLWQCYQSEQSNRRLSVALNNDSYEEYPRTDVIVPVQLKLFKAIEGGPFQQFLLQNGYRLLLERIIGAIA